MRDVVKLLRLRMEEHGLSQADVANRAGLSPSTLSRILDGTTQNPHRSTIQRIAAAVEAELPHDGESAVLESVVRDALAKHLLFVENWASQISFRDLMRPRTMASSYLDLDILDPSVIPDQDVRRMSGIFEATGNFVILGNAGVGKTTSLKHLALTALQTASEEGAFVPLVLLLRTLHSSQTLIDAVSAVMGLRPIPRSSGSPQLNDFDRKLHLVNLLNTEKILLLLDGLDEVVPAVREAVVEDLRFLFVHASDFRVVLTCRSAEYRYHLENSYVIQIASLTEQQIARFAAAWLSSELATNFTHAVNESPFAGLANRPIVIAHLCAIYERTGMLPDNSWTVYRRIIRLLVEEWDEQRGVRRVSRFASFPLHERGDLLQAIAYHLSANAPRASAFSHPELERAYRSVAPTFNLPVEHATSIVRELESHTGLIVQVGYEKYEFAHKSIQEFLVASYLLRMPSLPGDVLMQFPEETAIAVALSPNSAEYFASLMATVAPDLNSGHWPTAVANHIRRVKLEAPDFRPSTRLGWTLLSLYSAGVRAQAVLLTDSIRALLQGGIARESVRGALGHAVLEHGVTGKCTIRINQDELSVSNSSLPLEEPLEVDRDLLELIARDE